MQIIYSRVSTDKQIVENQLHHLRQRYPLAEIVKETVSGKASDKPVLNALLARLQRGDVLVVAALDRLGRRASTAIGLIEDLYSRGVVVVSVREGVDYSTSSGRMIANVLLSLAQMERDLISERTKLALTRLKAEGRRLGRPAAPKPGQTWKALGRPKKFDQTAVSTVVEYRQMGLSIRQINKLTNISTGRICQLLKSA
ncbi:unnamed protein product [Sphagnum balticum]